MDSDGDDGHTGTDTDSTEFDAQAGAPSVLEAVEYTDVTSLSDGSGETHVQIAFDQDVYQHGDALDSLSVLGSGDVTVWKDGTEISPSSVDPRLDNDILDITLANDVLPNENLKINVKGQDDAGNAIATNVSVTVTGETIDNEGDEPTSGSSGTNGDSFNTTTYAGTQVAVVNGDNGFSADEDLFIQTAAGTFVNDFTFGENSYVYVFDTSDRNLSATYEFKADGGGVEEDMALDLRELGLSASADATDLKNDEAVTASVSANAGNREVDGTLYYANDSVAATDSVTLDGSGAGTFDFGTQGAADYYVEASDVKSGVTATTDDISVTGYADADAAFSMNQYEDERGDTLNITVSITGESDTATMYVGQAGVNYMQEVSVTDGDDDGEVIVSFNTYADADDTTSFSAPYADDDTASATPTGQSWNNAGELEHPMAATGYDMNITAVEGEEQSVAAVSLSPRTDQSMSTWVSPSSKAVSTPSLISSNAVEQTSTALGDNVVFEVSASSFEGFMGASSYNVTTLNETNFTKGLYLTVTQTDTGVNAPAATIDVDAGNLVKDLDNNAFYVTFDTSDGAWTAGEG